MSKHRMICPVCGAEMNHHATKIVYSVDEPTSVDEVLGGAAKEVHTCPRCGRIELRPASA